ncbi:MAG TPA: hypothetical protein VM779_03930 [Thermoanaerobaculia bacterium]|nr:hypothetical protein [Thermoanaerobaculia bacterium]
MKRTSLAVTLSLLVLATGALLHAQSSSTLTVKPSEMRDGETKTITDDGRTITVRRDGDTTRVAIDGAAATETLTITREGGRILIGRLSADGSRSLVIGPDRDRIAVDGLDLDRFEALPRFRSIPERSPRTVFVCPKDQTTLRVPKDKAEESYRCPVDGTPMEKRKGHGVQFFFDDSATEL